MPLLTMKILAAVLHLHGPDAAIKSDNQGIDQLLGNICEELPGRTDEQLGGAPESSNPYLIQVRSRRGRGGGGGDSGTRRPSTAKEPAPFARTIFRKGGYGKSVYGPKHRRVFED